MFKFRSYRLCPEIRRETVLRADRLVRPDLKLENPPARIGRFRPIEFLGRGAFGTVWRVRDPLRPDADLALKTLTRVAGRNAGTGARTDELRMGLAVQPAGIAVPTG